ncbi:MAG: Dyp-type peroxidase [Dehalococcoidia bacterium]
MSCQKGILERPQDHATIFALDLRDSAAAADCLSELWGDVTERLHDWYSAQNLTITLGFGIPLFEKLGRMEAKPRALKLMPGWEGDAFDPKEAQADLIVQVCSDERSVNYYVERAVLRHLSRAFTLKTYYRGFSLPESRGVLGFVDGTGNPKGDARLPVVLIGDEEERYRGGSYLVLRKIREDLDRWERLTVDEQERVIGRRKVDSARFDPPETTPPNSHREKSSVRTDGGEVEILRRSFPFASPQEAGLIFICFVRGLSQYEAIKDQMVSRSTRGRDVGKDAIEEFYTAVSGGYYFVPPEPGHDGYVGDFLFEVEDEG